MTWGAARERKGFSQGRIDSGPVTLLSLLPSMSMKTPSAPVSAVRTPRPTRASQWTVREAPAEAAIEISRRHQIHEAVARVLAARGWIGGSGKLEAYLNPTLKDLRSPFELHEMDRAAERAIEGIRRGERICVYGDYDVDGVSATALLAGALRFLGADPMIVIPHRLNDGYGMNIARVEEIAAGGCTLLITVDTGVTAVEPVRRAAELGIEVIVTDHHLAGDELPATCAFINPNRADALYEYGRLCGVGVAFKFAHAMLRQAAMAEADARRFLMDQLDLVALGTIADVVPILGENRVLVKHGLEMILNTKRPGLRALMEVSGIQHNRITAENVAFGLGPRINAAGRTSDPTIALQLLMTTNAAEGKSLARRLDDLNRERRVIEDEILVASRDAAEDALAARELHALVIGGTGWHLGVVGIVAARLTELYELPAIVLAIESDLAKGSARSIPGFDIHGALNACSGHLVTYGGHSAAAGLKLHSASIPQFREALNAHAADVMAGLDRTRTIVADSELLPDEFTWRFHEDLQRLQPFGEGNPSPLFLMRGVQSAAPPRIVGHNHLRTRLRAGGMSFDSIGFRLGHLKGMFEAGPVDILFRPKENVWNGQTNLEMELVDGRPRSTDS